MKLGIEKLLEKPNVAAKWGRCALLCNQASVTQNFQTAWSLLHDILGKQLVAFFGPQHGFHATVQDNMIETDHNTGPYGLPVYSLYSATREPLDEMLKDVDTIVIDLQIVGCRVYTFKYTIAGCLRAAKRLGKKVVVLDRPNPVGGEQIEGRVLNLEAKSFVGEFEIPLRHGLTAAESALYFNSSIGADLEYLPLENWDPSAYWGDIFSQWILTSPNLPTLDSVYVYPATVMLEGTNLSEGRGTGLPFQFVGAPYIKDGERYARRVRDYYDSKGFYLRPAEFQPTSQKFAGEACRGFQIHVVKPREIETFALGLAIMKAAMDLGEGKFEWKKPGYEYNYSDLPIDLILGHLQAHRHIEQNFSVKDSFWYQGLNEYQEKARPHLLYPRKLIKAPW